MGEKLKYTLVGLFVLLLGSGLIAATLWLSTETQGKTYHVYLAYFSESVSGLDEGSDVRYRGVKVGRVRKIALDADDPERVRLLLAIQQGTPIKVDTQATLAMQGITGLVYVELSGGRRDSPPLRVAVGKRYPEIPSVPSRLAQLETGVAGALTDLRGLSTHLEGVAANLRQVMNQENRENLARILQQVRLLTQTLSAPENLHSVQTVLHSGASASERLPALVEDADRTFQQAQQTLHAIRAAAQRLGATMTQGGGDLRTFLRSTEGQLVPLLEEVRRLVATLQRFAEQLERNPSILLRGAPGVAPGPGEAR